MTRVRHPAIADGVIVISSPRLLKLVTALTPRTRIRGLALANVVVVGEVLDSRLLVHETEHVLQWMANPMTFWIRYLWQCARYGYRQAPYEVEARARARPVWPHVLWRAGDGR